MRTILCVVSLSLLASACVVDVGADRGEPPGQRPPAALTLEYVERVTRGAPDGARLPTVIAIHGLGDTPENFARVFDSLPVKARLVYPRGPLRHQGGFAWTKHRVRGGEEQAFREDLSRRVTELAALLSRLEARPEIDPPFVVTGFSQGGFLSYALTLAHPSLVRAAFPIGGGLPRGLRDALPHAPRGAPRIVAFHGAADRLVPYADDRALAEELRGRGWRAEVRAYEGVGHSIPPAMRRDVHDAIAESLGAPADQPGNRSSNGISL